MIDRSFYGFFPALLKALKSMFKVILYVSASGAVVGVTDYFTNYALSDAEKFGLVAATNGIAVLIIRTISGTLTTLSPKFLQKMRAELGVEEPKEV